MRHFDKYVDTCDKCNKIVRIGTRTGESIMGNAPNTIITYKIHIPEIDRVCNDYINFGCLCQQCYDKYVVPKLEELQHIKNISDARVITD